MGKNRIRKISIKNFRAIGPEGVEIDIDDIVVLVGQNNTAKTTILKAIRAVTENTGENSLDIEDFHKKDCNNYPEIIVETIVNDKTKLGNEWILKDASGIEYVKEKWLWEDPKRPKRTGWLATKNDWAKEGEDKERYPWGVDNIAMTRRPEPHEIDAFDNPEIETEKVKKLLVSLVEKRIKELISDETHKDNASFKKVVTDLKKLRKGIISNTESEIKEIQKKLNEYISPVFPGHAIEFDPKPDEEIESVVESALINRNADLLMGTPSGHKSLLNKQGSGTRRTLLWIALKLTAEMGANKKTKSKKKNESEEQIERPHILLLNEPEICLHPDAIRDARDTLYQLPETGTWQVMITTHSPIFIDLSKDNTTIIRVEKDNSGKVTSDTIFRPQQAQLTDDDKENLKLLNIFDPYFAEFFFANHVIVVEGDTEYSVFRYLLSERKLRNIHIIRGRGKAVIVSILKILNHFGKSYAVLHDADMPLRADGKKNAMWTMNDSILNEFNKRPRSTNARLIASIRNFEEACISDGIEVDKDKPFEAVRKIKEGATLKQQADDILDSLIDFTKALPERFIEWKSLSDLEKEVKK